MYVKTPDRLDGLTACDCLWLLDTTDVIDLPYLEHLQAVGLLQVTDGVLHQARQVLVDDVMLNLIKTVESITRKHEETSASLTP